MKHVGNKKQQDLVMEWRLEVMEMQKPKCILPRGTSEFFEDLNVERTALTS